MQRIVKAKNLIRANKDGKTKMALLDQEDAKLYLKIIMQHVSFDILSMITIIFTKCLVVFSSVQL